MSANAESSHPKWDAGDIDWLDLEIHYPYGYMGRQMIAIRSHAPMSAAAEGLVGKGLVWNGHGYRIVAVHRQFQGPIAAGEPLGIEVELASGGSVTGRDF